MASVISEMNGWRDYNKVRVNNMRAAGRQCGLNKHNEKKRTPPALGTKDISFLDEWTLPRLCSLAKCTCSSVVDTWHFFAVLSSGWIAVRVGDDPKCGLKVLVSRREVMSLGQKGQMARVDPPFSEKAITTPLSDENQQPRTELTGKPQRLEALFHAHKLS